jgi:hypothetical protein
VEKRHCDRNEGPLAWSEDGGEIEAAPAAMDANATLLATTGFSLRSGYMEQGKPHDRPRG